MLCIYTSIALSSLRSSNATSRIRLRIRTFLRVISFSSRHTALCASSLRRLSRASPIFFACCKLSRCLFSSSFCTTPLILSYSGIFVDSRRDSSNVRLCGVISIIAWSVKAAILIIIISTVFTPNNGPSSSSDSVSKTLSIAVYFLNYLEAN